MSNDLPEPSGKRPVRKAGGRVDPCEGMAMPSQPEDSASPARATNVERRYLYDAEFHMRVELVVQTIERERRVRLDPADRSLVTLAAAYAIEMEEER